MRTRRQRLLDGVERALTNVTIPQPFSLEDFCRQLSRDRGRPMHLHQMPEPTAAGYPCGMWLATPDADHIFYARGSSPLHQQNIILHEIGHLLCDHQGLGAAAAAAGVMPDLDPSMVQRMLARTTYATDEEQSAELVAALILERAGWSSQDVPPSGIMGVLHGLF